MKIGVPVEEFTGERRVALVPASIPLLKKAGLEVVIQQGAGVQAGFTDAAYRDKGAQVVEGRAAVFANADVILQVRLAGAAGEQGRADFALLRRGQIVIGMADPLGAPEAVRDLAATSVTSFALELIPRITRAQSMDVLSSMATIGGYKAVLLAAGTLPRMFPLLTTAAGTITPAHVFIVGVGVAGLQAISTARRLGAVVEAYDVRPAVKEQVQSVGAKFVELPLETAQAEDKGGYAKAQDESFYQRQRDMMKKVVAANDVVITTAVVPGKKAPVLVTAEMVHGMAPGSVVVDLAAERGGNCELTRPDQVVVEQGVTILGPTNLPSTVPYHASQMYAKNITTFLLHLVKDGNIKADPADEIARETLITEGGEVVNPRIRQALGLADLPAVVS
ncbi:MAG: Re/Si-specific NAD(P)(+) transhydrogenase subunit alpha [Vicinamibacterales bacterium]|nr:Re/Si-specific NAD(P)(+) transhydrogenase subunit alpha [Vicinamibacterales bacterium]